MKRRRSSTKREGWARRGDKILQDKQEPGGIQNCVLILAVLLMSCVTPGTGPSEDQFSSATLDSDICFTGGLSAYVQSPLPVSSLESLLRSSVLVPSTLTTIILNHFKGACRFFSVIWISHLLNFMNGSDLLLQVVLAQSS